MSDNELDREWQSTNRPQSTMARSFSLALNDLFKIDNSVADLDAAVFEKKKAVSSQTSELEALEARLKATEELLQRAGISPLPRTSDKSSPRNRPAIGDTFEDSGETPASQLAKEFKSCRPNTGLSQMKEGRPGPGWKGEAAAYNPAAPCALPPTPGASEGESDSEDFQVARERNRSADESQDGHSPRQM